MEGQDQMKLFLRQFTAITVTSISLLSSGLCMAAPSAKVIINQDKPIIAEAAPAEWYRGATHRYLILPIKIGKQTLKLSIEESYFQKKPPTTVQVKEIKTI